MSTLYVSDLDGTLLRDYQKKSKKTNQIINRLVGGRQFVYAWLGHIKLFRKPIPFLAVKF